MDHGSIGAESRGGLRTDHGSIGFDSRTVGAVITEQSKLKERDGQLAGHRQSET